MAVVGSVPFDSAWQLDAAIPDEEHSFPFLHEGLDEEMHDRIDVFSSNDVCSVHHAVHDYIEPLPFMHCSSSPSESFYATSRRYSGCSASNGDEATIIVPPSNIRFVSPMQNRFVQASRETDLRVSKECDHSDMMVCSRSSWKTLSKDRRQKQRRTEKDWASVPACPQSANILEERRAIKPDDRSESDGGSCYDDDKSLPCRYYYDYYRREELSRDHDMDGFHRRRNDEHLREYSPETFIITRERMTSFMRRSEETRSQVLMHLHSYPLDSPISVRTNEDNFHSTRESTTMLCHSWSIHPDDRYPLTATCSLVTETVVS